jgi:hypothetical protein
MRKLPDGRCTSPTPQEERLRVLSACANEHCDAVFAPAARPSASGAMDAIVSRFAEAVPVPHRCASTWRAQSTKIGAFARIIKVDLAQTRSAATCATSSTAPHPAHSRGRRHAAMPLGALLEQLSAGRRRRDKNAADAQARAERRHPGHQQHPGRGLQAQRRAAHHPRDHVPRDGLQARAAVRARRAQQYDERALRLRPRGAGELAKQLRFSLAAQPDNVFNVATAKGVDILISDIDDPKIAARVPATGTASRCLAHLRAVPAHDQGPPVAMIYADKDRPGEIEISEQELALLRTLRNQAVLAIKQAG